MDTMTNEEKKDIIFLGVLLIGTGSMWVWSLAF